MKKRKHIAANKANPVPASEKHVEHIRRRAYDLYELQGRQDGHDLDHWLAAEAEITGKAAR